LLAGCARDDAELQPYLDRPLVIAVAPALNHSGSTEFDGVRVADLMVSELGQFGGVKTLPVNRVLAQLYDRRAERVESSEEALELARRLGADRMLVFAITEYDPYQPPVVGITAQLYGPASRSSERSGETTDNAQEPGDRAWPSAEVQRVFNGQDQAVQREIQAFARRRDGGGSPHGWRLFLASQEEFLRYCCHSVLRELIRQEVAHVAPGQERS
jgi:hypothetical protein